MSNILELKKDIWTPGCFMKAGIRKTKKEWERLFPDANIDWETEWFIDLSEQKEEVKKNMLDQIVDDVFTSKGLHSITYKEAAKEVANRFHNYKKSEIQFP